MLLLEHNMSELKVIPTYCKTNGQHKQQKTVTVDREKEYHIMTKYFQSESVSYGYVLGLMPNQSISPTYN